MTSCSGLGFQAIHEQAARGMPRVSWLYVRAVMSQVRSHLANSTRTGSGTSRTGSLPLERVEPLPMIDEAFDPTHRNRRQAC